MPRLIGKIALISGASRGMGAAFARAIVAEGGQVVAGVRDVARAKESELAESLGDAAVFTELDVRNTDDWAAAVQLAHDTFGGLNVLVNNAGIVNFGPLGKYSTQDWDDIIATNLTGPFLGISTARDELVRCSPSSIINISSATGVSAISELHGYVASKYGLRGLTRSVALELAASGVRANCVLPGTVATDMNKDLDVTGFNPMNRKGDVREVASLVVYLASDESLFTTGADIPVDGGELAGRVPALERLD